MCKRYNFKIDGVVQAKKDTEINSLSIAKVVFFIWPGTASSAERVAIVFERRSDSKFFGKSTVGLINATNGFVFNNEESYFLISTAYVGDKDRNILPEFVQPDMVII